MNQDRENSPTRGTERQLPSQMNREEFVEVYGAIYEHSPWIAERVFDAGVSEDHDSADGLHEALARVVNDSGEQAQLALLRAHPDLAGRLAVAGELTPDSSAEQASVGLDRCTEEEFERFQSLNDAYKAKFGFPFILAVRGRERSEILSTFEQRLSNTPEAELKEALTQVHRIALLRLRNIAPLQTGAAALD